ncbi:MAG: energy-coupling factor ABC transporter ATP-binding protein [Lachnospiraceae bacterium]|nr:energy-coupling factor ABC transporter ATP-binding protein [Lachnospiraceae bacterium]
MSPQTFIELKNVGYTYPGIAKSKAHDALTNINLKIHTGEKIALLGANGSGKSTLFLLLNGILTATSGTILYQGNELSKKNVGDLRKYTGLVFQDPDSQIIASTVKEEVSFGPINLGLSKEEVNKRCDLAIEQASVSHLKDRPCHYLSGGEKKRVTIADIVAMEPGMFLFDEPASSLDPENSVLLEENLNQLSKQGKTIFVATHDMDFAYRFADRILILKKGQLIYDGDAQNAFANEARIHDAGLVIPALYQMQQILKDKGILPGNASITQVDELKQFI